MSLEEMVGLLAGLKASVVWAGKELAPEVQFRVFLLARKLEKGAKERKEDARDALLDFVEAQGKPDEKGSKHFTFEEGKASRTYKKATAPKVSKVEALFAEKGLVPGTVIQEKVTTTTVVDVSKLDQLVKLGQLTQVEVDACYDESYAFNATETRDSKKLLEGIG